MNNAIRKYESPDQQKFKDFYFTINKKDEKKRLIKALKQDKTAKRTWQVGLVGILGLCVSKQQSYGVLLAQLIIWSASVGFAWYKLLKIEYDQKLSKTYQTMAFELDQVIQETKSCAWVMEEEGKITGTVAFKFEHGNEGKIGYLTGRDSRIRLMLVQRALRFAKENEIGVISKWDGDFKFGENAL